MRGSRHSDAPSDRFLERTPGHHSTGTLDAISFDVQDFRGKRSALAAGIYLACGAEGGDGTPDTLTFISSEGNSSAPQILKIGSARGLIA